MLLANEKNIREVTLFPMNQNAQDLMMNAPSKIDNSQLKELSIKKDIKKLIFDFKFKRMSLKSTNFPHNYF